MRVIYSFVFLTLILLSVIAAAGTLESDFQDPPRETGVRCWWWWLNSNVTKEAITKDLEAMHDKGFSGAMIFDAGTELWWGPDKPVPNGPRFSGPEWTELFLHALKEAKRLDLKLGLSIQSGWNLGGPYVTLDEKAKQITSSEIQVQRPAQFNQKLPVPKSNYNYYRDICVLAYWYKIVDPLLKKAGPMAGTVLTQLETDSWECGGMNWSPAFAEDFRRYNGYDIIKYLPVVAGKIVESRQVSNAFLADLRKTIAHCVSENHYKTFTEHAARYNMEIQPECSGPHAAPIDGITNYSHSDIVMSEFWIPSPHRPNPENRFFI